jgi:hypothetical protein
MSAARLRLVECREILGGARDPLRAVWDEQATAKDRRLLLAMAGHASSMAGRLAGRAWCDLLPETRAAIAGGLRRWREWSERLQ